MKHLQGSGTPVLYIGRTVPKGYYIIVNDMGSHRVHTFYVPRLCSILA
jgi:hypothetical protein